MTYATYATFGFDSTPETSVCYNDLQFRESY